MLQSKFETYSLNHDLAETEELKKTMYRDFYNVRKVDTHIHAAGSMNTKHFLTFVRKAFKEVKAVEEENDSKEGEVEGGSKLK